MSRLRRLLAAVAHSGPGYQPTPLPARGDAVEAWLKAQRGATTSWDDWHVLDNLLDRYRLHADTGTPLGEHICEGRVAGDCECLEVTDA